MFNFILYVLLRFKGLEEQRFKVLKAGKNLYAFAALNLCPLY